MKKKKSSLKNQLQIEIKEKIEGPKKDSNEDSQEIIEEESPEKTEKHKKEDK